MRRLLVSFALPADGPSWRAFEAALREFVGDFGLGLEFLILAGEGATENQSGSEPAKLAGETDAPKT